MADCCFFNHMCIELDHCKITKTGHFMELLYQTSSKQAELEQNVTFTGEAFLVLISSALVSMILSMALPAGVLSIIIGTILMSQGKAPMYSVESKVFDEEPEYRLSMPSSCQPISQSILKFYHVIHAIN